MIAISDKRKHPRMKMQFSVYIANPDIGKLLVETLDMSDGGLYVKGPLPLEALPEDGAIVNVQVNGMLGTGCAGVPMKVVRGDPEGLALGFLH
jgi:hypothetical protein